MEFGVAPDAWKALVEAVFPLATSIDSIVLALSYCRARKLDPFKRVIHIVPIWNKDLKKMVDTIWPGIGELRTTAFRTGCYAGRGATTFGPDTTMKVGEAMITFPEWAQVTVRRLVKGVLVEFAGPQVYWLETYATQSRNDNSPNSMWSKRPRGQLEKCAEAAALRAAFPEEVGDEYAVEEVGMFASAEPRKLLPAETGSVSGSSPGSTVSQRIADELAARKAAEAAAESSTSEGVDESQTGSGPQGDAPAKSYEELQAAIGGAASPDDIADIKDELNVSLGAGLITVEQANSLAAQADSRGKPSGD